MKRNHLLIALSLGVVLALGACKSTPKAPSEPDKVVMQGVEAIKTNKPANIYAMLPDSYKADIQGLVTEGAAKLDKETFELGVKVLDKAISALDKQGDKIAASPMAKQIPGDFKKMVETIKTGYGLIKDAGLTDYDMLKGLKVEELVSDHGEKLMKFGRETAADFGRDYDDFYAMLDKTKVKVLSSEGDNAELEITMGDDTEKAKFTKVEGKWVPAEMAETWKPMMDQAKKEMLAGLEEAEKNKAETKKTLEALLAALDKFEKDGDMQALMGLGKMF